LVEWQPRKARIVLPYLICQSAKIATTEGGITTGYRRCAHIATAQVLIAIGAS